MKFSAIATLAAVAALAISAHAATGTPSEQETGTQRTSEPSAPAVQDPQVGSYARYLMLNGKTREQAIAQARNVDHPAASQVARRPAAPRAAATESPEAPVQQ